MDHLFKRKKEKPRQEWNPHWSLKLLYGLWTVISGFVKIALGAAVTVMLIVLVCMFVFVGILGSYLTDDVLPNAEYYLESAVLDQTSFVYYVDGDGNIQQLQEIHTSANRQWAELEDIPQALIDATVAIEDKRFYEHQGVDWITTVKACANMFFGNGDFGGSTITQQLLKNLTGDDDVTVQRKVMEIFRAQIFEQKYDKDTIMEWYLNTIYLGRGCYGVKSAAEEYFGKELQSLTVAECASLISITNNPSIFNPYSESVYMYDGEERDGAQRNQYRQINTLWSMREEGFLTEEEYQDALYQAENGMVFKSGIADEDKWTACESDACGYEGIAATFTANEEGYLCPSCGGQVHVAKDSSQEVYSYFVDTVIEDVAKDLATQDGVDWSTIDKETREIYMLKIQRGGYHIYSTLDMDVQNAVDSIYTDLSKIPTAASSQQLQSAMVIIDNTTGDIVAMAGGVGQKTVHDAYNRATDAKLQTGSSMKPLTVYAPAFEVGEISPATVVTDLPVTYTENGGYPKNDNRKYSYSRTIYSAIVNSVNAVAVNTLRRIGYDYSYMFAKEKFGISTLTDHYETSYGKILNDLGDAPLGMGALTVGATVRDMAAAYATFANNGVYREARTYTKVYDSEGQLVLDREQASEQILSEKTVSYINYCLNGAVTSGTGTPAQITGQMVAGKTGSTSSNYDRWFCGYTAHYTAAVWCGYDQPEAIKLTGSNTRNPAARLFASVMTPIHEGLKYTSLYSTSTMRTYSVCLDSGARATDACSKDLRYYLYGSDYNRVASAYAEKDDAPEGTCEDHVLVDYCVTGGGVATEYCKKFENVEIASRALVKMTESDVEEIKKAASSGLWPGFSDDCYVYYEDGDWHGFDGKANKGVSEPYIVCTEHTKDAWEDYQAEKKKEEEEKKKQEEEANNPIENLLNLFS